MKRGLASLDGLRMRIRALYDFHPDDSHGEAHRNRGVVMALRVVEETAGTSFGGRCQRSADPRQTATVWCLTHGAPMGGTLWCDFAERPWEWREQGPIEPPAASKEAVA